MQPQNDLLNIRGPNLIKFRLPKSNHPTTLYYAAHGLGPDAKTASVEKNGHEVSQSAEMKVRLLDCAGKFEGANKIVSPVALDSSKGDRYRPPNFRRFALEIDFFRKLLALCKREHIECVVVNMPMSVAHRAILDRRLDQQYLTETKNACATYGARYFDFNDRQFVDNDFSDGFYVNAAGAEKVMKRLVAAYETLPNLRSGVGAR